MAAIRWLLVGFLLMPVSCDPRGHVEEGIFFPTWDANGASPTGIVQGVLVEADRCLFVEQDERRTLVVWEAGMGYHDGSLLDLQGEPIARTGELIHGGGGYYADRTHMEDLSGGSVPARCIPEGSGERFAIIYEVEAGPFE